MNSFFFGIWLLGKDGDMYIAYIHTCVYVGHLCVYVCVCICLYVRICADKTQICLLTDKNLIIEKKIFVSYFSRSILFFFFCFLAVFFLLLLLRNTNIPPLFYSTLK